LIKKVTHSDWEKGRKKSKKGLARKRHYIKGENPYRDRVKTRRDPAEGGLMKPFEGPN